MGKQYFVKTSDKTCADELIKNGFSLINESQGVWTFINDGKITFGDMPKSAIYTDIIYG